MQVLWCMLQVRNAGQCTGQHGIPGLLTRAPSCGSTQSHSHPQLHPILALTCTPHAALLCTPHLHLLPQIQMRDIPGFVDTRYQLLQLKPSNRTHWISFAVAHHLDRNYEVAVQVRSRGVVVV